MSGNIADRLRESAVAWPERAAVIDQRENRRTFAELDREVDQLVAGLQSLGLTPGRRIVLMVRPGIEFIALTFALFRAGAIVILIDPGMGRTNIFRCLEEVEPEGFVAIPVVQLIRWWKRREKVFRSARLNVTVGMRIPGFGPTYGDILKLGGVHPPKPVSVAGSDPAAVIFTSGSTGPPKGVAYEHGMFGAQVELIQRQYGIEPGEVDLPGFPLFGLFNAAMGVTTVVPDMNPTRPAQVDPVKILRAIERHGVTQAFGSPAFWNRVGRYCDEHRITLPTIRRALSAGGPVPNHVLERMARVLNGPNADLFTPYGATESLPAASIGGREVLSSTAARTRKGAGTCVGRPFPEIEIRIIRITDGPVAALDVAEACGPGEIGEIIVRGRSVTREYFRRPEATAVAKIADPRSFPGDDRPSVWHRIGDVGYIDGEGLLWFCGRKAHIVHTRLGSMYSVCCEAIFETHPHVYRAALVGIGDVSDEAPVIVIEPEAGKFPETPAAVAAFRDELLRLGAGSPLTSCIREVMFHRSLPVDTRHNVKIQREALKEWAAAVSGRR
ncbi:4-chlorobenzoate--CoA ligase [Caulifigura coniformis]|uniref:4-chlorobenzoate--CoA ligase n=1 Tax=Caulifigura coniformis TaxID=2527983 RepID=A0A517S8S9_9PLAN|nr:fatty acid CoA ligase family protein [Caulifigura coniformis]QDT52535.1 4-chlorobenzoate--CoA ligase [Caulifigura coniformis]